MFNWVRLFLRLCVQFHGDPVPGLQLSTRYQTYTHTYDSLECLHGTTFRSFSNISGKLKRRDVSPAFFSTSLIINPNFDLATLAVTRLQAIITTFLLRRMKDSKLDGKRLIELPEKNVGMIQLEFSPEERDIYRMVNVNIF